MATTITEAQAQLISSLAPDDIPIKLRCAICSNLAVNAFRLPCCEQAICENCQQNLPPSCPVCEHSPLTAEDCNPNKSLRTTIRVFLRTEEKKRETSRPKETKDSTPATPVEATKPQLPAPESTPQEEVVTQDEDAHVTAAEAGPRSGSEAAQDPAQGPDQDDQAGAPAVTDENDGQVVAVSNAAENDDEAPGGNEEQDDAEKPDGADQAEDDEENYDADVTANGGFSNPNHFNQMQMMMSMQNGMAPNSFGGFPMMGMPGMGMDLMAMQNMYMNGGGFQGMGMGDFGGGFGQDSNNNWNGSQSWNFDQNNYNQSGPGMATGDFGSFNSGYQTGYNQQGNYGNHFNDYRRGGFGRGRGRGRGFYGGYGRGGYQQGGYNNYQNQGQYSQQGYQADGQPDASGDKRVDQYGRDARLESDGQDKGPQPGEGAAADGETKDINSALASRETLGNDDGGGVSRNGQKSLEGPSVPGSAHGDAAAGTIRSVLTAPEAPINAPTGPKAMRQGLPNTSLHHLRARGFPVGPDSSSKDPQHASQSSRDNSRSNSTVRDRGRDRGSRHGRSKDRSKDYDERERERDARSKSWTSSKSRSRSRGQRSSHRRKRHRSESAGEDRSEDEHRRGKRKSRKHSSYHDDDEDYSRSKEDTHGGKSRSVSPDGSRRSGHRSRKDRDYEKRKDRERDKYSDDDRKRSSHRSHRDHDRDRSRRRDKDRDGDRDRERDKDRRDRKERHREKDREREAKHSSSRKHSVDEGATPVDKEFRPPTGPRGFDIKGSSRPADKPSIDRRGSQASLGATSSSKGAPTKDAHTLEREARNRERLLKEAQRMAGLAGLSGIKRGRDDVDDSGHGRKGRRVSRRSEAVGGGDEEERMRRLEAEREGGRWG